MPTPLVDHTLTPINYNEILYERRPCLDKNGDEIAGLFNAWIMINNPSQYNSYTTAAVKEIIMAFREASMDRSVVAVIFPPWAIKPFVPAVIRKNMLSIMRANLWNTNNICACSMI